MTDENSTDLLQSDQQSQSTSDQQLGWNCFDIAIDLAGKLNITSSDPTERAKQARKVLIEEAVDKASDSDYRELLAPEIRNAAALTVAAMNADNLESNDRNLLPSDMRTRELQNLYNDYNQVLDSDVVKEAIENCNVEFGFSAENRKNINELKEWFQDEINRVAYSQAYECYEQAENAIKEATGNFDNYCLREEVYRQYLQQYYGRNEWFAFQPDFSTSMVDVTAKLLNIQISIYNNDRNVIHQTGNYGSSVSVNFNQNHFTAMPDAIQSMEISEITEQPTTSKRKASLDDSNSPIILKKMDILPKTNDTFSASGVKHSLHGVAYQWKILMMLAKQCQKYGYSFRLATEKDDADKFDDAVLLYKISARTNIINYIFLQAKHIQEESASKQAIKENDLLTETDDKFSLQKYFISFQKIKRNYEFEEGCQKYFVIYTNIGFGFDSYSDHPGLNKLSSLYFKSIPNPNELLNIENEGNCYQLDIESEPETVRRLKEIFEKTSDCQKLTNDLIECILNEKSIGLDGQIKNNHKFLVKYVFDLENNKFNKDFINGEIVGDLSDDINGFRDVLLEKIREYLEEKSPKERTKLDKKILTKLSSKPQKKKRKLTPGKSVGLWSVFEELDLEFSPGFRNITIFEPIPQIEDPTGVAENIFRLINRHKDSDKAINVQRGDARGNQILISELNNLAGHVLVKKIKGGKEYAGFSDKFLNDNNEELPGNISELREELMQAFEVTNKADLKGKIDAYIFNISKFEPCKETDFESLLNAEIFVPAPNITEEEIEEFLNHLIFMVNQPHERELSVLIGKEVGEEFNLIDDTLITSNFQDKIVNWLKEKAGTYITENEMQNFFDAMSSAISQFVMIGPTSEYTKKLDEYGLVFANLNRKLTEFLNQFEDSPNIFNFVTPKGETMLGSIEVSQILRGITEYKQEDSYIFVRLSTFIRLDDRIILAFKKKQTKLLIIECNLEKQRIENLGVGGLLDSLSENKKLLLISSKGNGLINEFKKGNITLKGKFEEMEYKMNFGDLNKESQNKILRSKIDFQGNSVDLHKIVSANSALIELLSLVDLLKGKQIKIGEAIPITYGYDPDYYIDRTFNKYTIINEDIFIDRDTGALSDALATSKEEFEELTQKYPRANVHWLEKNEFGRLILQKTQGKLFNLRKYLQSSHPAKVFPTNTDENIRQFIKQMIGQKVVILADTAGMGKSTVLTHLSKIIKNIDPSYWVVRINLNNHTDVLKEKEFSHFSYPEVAMEFVTDDLLKIGSDLEREIFKSLLSEKKVVLMLDGFDEISPSYKSTVIRLLQGLKETSVQQLWVTTRPHLKEDLEEELHQVAYTLEAFTVENQVEFLTKFWKKTLNSIKIDEIRIEKFSRELVEKLASSINDKDKEFTGVPLQSHMLAEAFDEEFKEYYHSEGSKHNLPEKLDLLELYDKFLNRKYLVYVSEKNNPTIINVATADLINILKGGINLRKIHQHLAIKMLVPQREKLLLENRKPRDLPNEKLSRIGIAQFNDKIEFVHRTFAEYYVADFLVELLKKEKETSKDIQEFVLKDVFLLDNYQVVRSFVNNFLNKIDLPEMTLKEYGERINDLEKDLRQREAPSFLVPLSDPLLISAKQDRELFERENPQKTEQMDQDDIPKYIPSASSLRQEEEQIIDIWGKARTYYAGTGGTIFHQAAQENNPYITYFLLNTLKDKKYQKLVKSFILHKDYVGQTIWYGAALNGDKDMLVELWSTAESAGLSQGELKELLIAKDGKERTAWHWVTKSNELELLDIMWDWGKSINLNLKNELLLLEDKYKRTAWCWAAQYGNIQTVNKLWELAEEQNCGKDLFTHIDSYGKIWQWAAQNDNVDVLERLWELNKDITDIVATWLVAVEIGNVKMLDKLIERFFCGELLHSENFKGETAWILAAKNNRTNILDKLLNLTKNNDESRKKMLFSRDKYGSTAFNTAAKSGHEEMLEYQWNVAVQMGLQEELLLDSNEYRQTAFYMAVWMGHSNLLEKIWEWSDHITRNLFLLRQHKCHLSIWFASVHSQKVDVFTRIRELTEEYLAKSEIHFRNQLLQQIEDTFLIKGMQKRVPRNIWIEIAMTLNVDILQAAWDWTKVISDNPRDLKNPFLTIAPINGTIWNETLSITGYKKKFIQKLISLSEEAHLTPEEFKTIWLTKNDDGKTPLEALQGNYHQVSERRPILDLVQKHYSKINGGSLEGLLNELNKFAVANSYFDKVRLYLNKGADVRDDTDLLPKAVHKKDWNIAMLLFRYGASIEALSVEECDSFRKFIAGSFHEDKTELLMKFDTSEII